VLLTVHDLFAQEEAIQTPMPSVTPIQVLGDKVEVLEEINTKILNTIYFALGSVGAIMLAIVGLNFFQNFSLNNRKIDSIKAEIEATARASREEEVNAIKNTFMDFTKKAEEKLDEATKAIESRLEKKYDAIEYRLDKAFKGLKDQVEELNRDLLITKAFEYKKTGQMGYILNLINVLENDIKKDWGWRIVDTLTKLMECLDSSSPNPDALVSLQRALNQLKPEYKVQKESIESKMKKNK
jgi:gas vesicle protein